MSTKQFDVLNPKTLLEGKFFLEASAGTGKTFSIENIFLRKLLNGVAFESILVVTFTNAAVRDLKERIHKFLKRALKILEKKTIEKIDYLTVDNLSDFEIKDKIRTLHQALSIFEQVQIFTIHSFCQRILNEFFIEGDLGPLAELKMISPSEMLKLIRHFFKLELNSNEYCQEQIEILLKSYREIGKLEKAILEGIEKNWQRTSSYQDLEQQFKNNWENFTHLFSFVQLQEDLLALNPARLEHTKLTYAEKVEWFTSYLKKEYSPDFFKILIKEGVDFLLKLKLKKQIHLHYPQVLEHLNKNLIPLILEGRNEHFIMSRLIHDCQKFILNYFEQQEILRFDDLLIKAAKAVDNPVFKNQVQTKYQCAIIDEFQDTDPLQWQIFNQLFGNYTSWQGSLFLVGDPKQSIYGFRRADIYTYLDAGSTIAESHHLSLATNYRSQKKLVEGLNCLFSQCEDLFLLPKFGQRLAYQSVSSSPFVEERMFQDDYAPIHFFYENFDKKAGQKFDELPYFHFIVSEIFKLKENSQCQLENIAILVNKHAQADRLATLLKSFGIPFVLQRLELLSKTYAYHSLLTFLECLLHPQDKNLIRTTLGTSLFGWSHEKILLLEQEDHMASMIELFADWHKILFKEGFGKLFSHLLNTCFPATPHSVGEALLSREEGLEFYIQLQQLAEELMNYESNHRATPQKIFQYLKQFEKHNAGEEDKIKCQKDPKQKGIRILTIHSSKGLEFEIVFALGLIEPSRKPEPFFVDRNVFCPILDSSNEEHLRYCQELDEEKMRQLYVAMTRAKYRLYLPIVFEETAKDGFVGVNSPMKIFLNKLLQKQNPDQTQSENFITFLEKQPVGFFSKTSLKNYSFSLKKFVDQSVTFELVPPKEVKIESSTAYLYSYSSMAQRLSKNVPQRTTELLAPSDWQNAQKNRFTLPAGSLTGNFIHMIFQKFPFEKAQNHEDINCWIKEKLPSPWQDWGGVFSDIIYQTLNVPLKPGLVLSQLSQERIFKEMEFLYPLNCSDVSLIKEENNGFLKGFIDLIFEFEGLYYLVDWKSNWLGPLAECYHSTHLHQAMETNHYFLQARIYQEALKNYLAIFTKKPFEEIFGGMAYLFVRGCSVEHPFSGIYFVSPQELKKAF